VSVRRGDPCGVATPPAVHVTNQETTAMAIPDAERNTTVARIHLWGAVTFGLSSWIAWLTCRRSKPALASQAVLSLMWNVPYLLIWMLIDTFYIVAWIAMAIRSTPDSHAVLTMVVIGAIMLPIAAGLNLAIACRAVRRLRVGVDFPYPFPPRSLAASCYRKWTSAE